MNIIVDEADRLTALVSSVMELSKVTSGAEKCEKVHFDMGQLCDEVSERYDAVCAQNGWQLKLELPEEELPVYADPNMMQRALHNLLGNAMHHIGGDGIFLLRAAKVPEGVRVEIEDHGPGICAEDLPISLTGITAPALMRASRAPAWGFPSPRPSSSSTASASACRARWAKARPSGSLQRIQSKATLSVIVLNRSVKSRQ